MVCIYTLRFFPFQYAVCFIILTYLVPILFTFYIQGVLKLKKSGAKRLMDKGFIISKYVHNNKWIERQLFAILEGRKDSNINNFVTCLV